jgi:hypothetical protein
MYDPIYGDDAFETGRNRHTSDDTMIEEKILAGERDPNGIAAKQPGAKLDAGKIAVYQGVIDYFPRAIRAVAQLSTFGAEKYSWKGWEKVVDGYARYKNAQLRHETDKAIEGDYDLLWRAQGKEVLHDTAVAWNALAALELRLRMEEAPAIPPAPVPAPLPQVPDATQKDYTKLPETEYKPPMMNEVDRSRDCWGHC